MRNAWISLLVLLFGLSLSAAAAPDLLLLKKYQPGMSVSGWLMSEKLDGVRAYWDGQQLLSRQGNPFAVPDWFIRDFPPFELDGELWIGRGMFEQISSITSRDKPHDGWRQLTYNIFEVPNTPGGLARRLQRLENYLARHPVAYIQIILQQQCLSDEHVQNRLSEITAAGGEGLVLRNPQVEYVSGRSKQALKVKRFDDSEAQVIGYRAGKGKYLGKVGALWVETKVGLRFYLGSGLSDRQRETPPPVGAIVTFKHQGFSRKGTPRFASFLRIRQLP